MRGGFFVLILVVALLCALLVAVFAVQNSGPVAVSFFTWQFEMSLVLIILGAAVLGAVAVFLLGSVRLLRQGRRLKEAAQRAERLEAELAKLTAPAQGENGPAAGDAAERNPSA
ncbi:MAG TPA: LapA family protein [Firmicutes bacterium]|nr:LapA family protein [Bacillota bacterium]